MEHALNAAASFPFNFFCLARNFANFPQTHPLRLPLLPRFSVFELLLSTNGDGVHRTPSLWHPLQMEVSARAPAPVGRSVGCSLEDEGKLLNDPESLPLSPSLGFLSYRQLKSPIWAGRPTEADGALYDPVFQNISVIGSGDALRVGGRLTE